MGLLAVIVISLAISPALAQVFISPGDVVSIPDGSATFFCTTPTISSDVVTSAQWFLNGTLLEDSDIDNVQTFAGTIQLRFSPVSLDYNRTRIRCRGTLLSGNIITSDEVMLFVQGLLSAADSLNITASDSTLSLTWKPPFTLDITNVVPDITGYCVDVVNSTSSVTQHSECNNITEPLFSYPIPPDADCHRYNFTVRAVNIVGVGGPATATFVAVEASPYTLNVVRVTAINPAIFNYMLNMSAPVCSSEVTLLSNLDTGEMLAFNSTDTTVHDNSTITITFNTSQVTDNHHYNVFVVAANSAGENSSRIVISTHDIINFFIATTGTEVTVETEYFEGSNATGALYVFIANDSGAVDFTRSALVILDRTSDDYELPFSLSAGPYKVFVYDIEENGLLSNEVGYPAVTDEVELARGTKQGFMIAYRQLEDCTSNVSVYLFTVECTYPSNSSATGFQIVVQQGDPDRVHMLYVNQTTDEQSSVTVEVEEGGTFFVSVIPILKDMGITNSSVEYTAILTAKGITTISNTEVTTVVELEVPEDSTNFALAVVLLGVIVLVTIGLLLLCVYIRKRKSMGNQSQTLEETPNDSHLSQSFQMALDSQEAVADGEILSPLYSIVTKREVANGVGTEPSEEFQDTDEIPPPLPPPCEDAAGTAGDQYAEIHPSLPPNEGMLIRDTELVYSTPAGYKTEHNQNYAFVQVSSANSSANVHEVSRDILDGIIYSDITQRKESATDLKQTPPPPPEKRDFSNFPVDGHILQ